MKLAQWSAMTGDQQRNYVQNMFDIVAIENQLAFLQMILGMWNIADRTSLTEADKLGLREIITKEQIESTLELFAARYNQLMEAGWN